MRPRHQLVPALLVAAALLAGCAANGGGQDGSTSDPPVKGVTTVVAKQIKFSPAAIEVPAGTYDYACTLHPQMTGRVVVTAKP